MYCKVLRGGTPDAQPAHWRRVSTPEPARGASSGLASEPQALAERLHECEERLQAAAAEQYRRGFQEGEQAAQKRTAAAVSAELRKLGDLIRELSRSKDQLRREAEADLVRLSIAIARRVVNRELQVEPEVLAGIAKSALAKIASREVVRLRAHPDVAALLRERRSEIGIPREAECVSDDSLAPGGIVIETTRGVLDASIETQLAEIERGLTDRLG